MSRKLPSFLAILAIAVATIGIWAVSSFNSLVGLEENVDNSFAKIETQFQRRLDLIPNVVKTVEGVADFEQETLQNVVAARSAWATAGTANEKITAANEFESALSRLLVTVEAYPELKATEAFRDLIVELEGTENRIAFARNEYNDTTTDYNKTVRKFPRNLIANLFGFEKEKILFKAAAGAEVVPIVDFGSNQ